MKSAAPLLVMAAYVLIAAAVLTFRPLQTPGPFLRDFEAYWSAGSAWDAGTNAYGRSVWTAERTIPGVDASRDELLPFVGPPAILPLWGTFARLDYVVAARVWCVLLFFAALGLALVTLRASGAGYGWPAIAATFALTVAFGPVSSDIALGQFALVSMLGATVAAYCATRARYAPVAAGSFLALLQPNVAGGLVALFGRLRTAAAVVAAAVAVYALGAAAAGWNWPAAYVQRLLVHQSDERGSAIQFTPAAIAHGFGASPELAMAVAIAAAAAALAAAVFAWRHVGDAFARFAAISALTPFAAGFFHEHDLLVAYVAAGWCSVRARGRTRTIALGATLFAAIDWLGLAQRPSGILQSALLAGAIACAFLAVGIAAKARVFTPSVPLTVAVVAGVFALVSWQAMHHPVPVWPDALGAYHASVSESAAQVWHEEQARSGLFAADPLWSVLRCLSLLGCALLAWCVTRTARVNIDAQPPLFFVRARRRRPTCASHSRAPSTKP